MYLHTETSLKTIHCQFIPNNALCTSKNYRVNSTLTTLKYTYTIPISIFGIF